MEAELQRMQPHIHFAVLHIQRLPSSQRCKLAHFRHASIRRQALEVFLFAYQRRRPVSFMMKISTSATAL